MSIERLGSSYGGWGTDLADLSSGSVIYAFGVGNDISWDLEMIRRLGCKIFAFDPDPDAAAWLASQDVPAEFMFTPVGIATFDGSEKFFHALKPGKINKSSIKQSSSFDFLPVRTLSKLMRERGHTHIDVLKLDIEGSEFAVIPTIAALPIRQLLVEIHSDFYLEGWKGLRNLYGWFRTKRLLYSLKRNGFVCVHKEKSDYTFLKQDLLL